MTTLDFLHYLDSVDVRLSLDDGRLRFDAPAGVVTSEVRAALIEHKAELVAVLQTPPPEPVPPWLPRPAELATWPDEDRERWGRRAAELEDAGTPWPSSERQAFAEVSAARSALTAAPPVVDGPAVPPAALPTTETLPLFGAIHP